MKNLIFSGVATALITPFKNGKIDYTALKSIIDFQLKAEINGIVALGTTGEASTLSEYERYKLYEFFIKETDGKLPLILGTGSNDTKECIKRTKKAKELGANAALIVTPYYNKGTESGIIYHYKLIANSVDLPIILYNVPSRTGVNLSIHAISELAKEENIVAIKEASDSIDRLLELSSLSEKITLYSGNDSQVYSTLALGGKGVISVLSNINPGEVLKITNSYFNGDFEQSLKCQKCILEKTRVLFSETNPAPIKYAMSLLGLCSEELRLPLTPPRESTKELLRTLFL